MNHLNFGKDEKMTAFADSIASFRLPRWEQIPTLGLYMDQVVTVIEKALSPILGYNGEAFITSSMINNYVKLGIVGKPEKKKYSREHIAGLIVITVLKQSLAIGDVRLGIDTVVKGSDRGASYDSFCDYVERALRSVAESLLLSEKNAEVRFQFASEDSMITMAACSFATKIFAAKMLSVIREDQAKAKE